MTTKTINKAECQYLTTCDSRSNDCNIKLKAKPVINDRFWIVDNGSQNVGTIEKTQEGVVYYSGRKRTFFKNIKSLTNDLNIVISYSDSAKTKPITDTGGFPTATKPHNVLYDVKHKTYVFTKTSKSKSYYCAGYFAVQLAGVWQQVYCPKLITIQRYPYLGPFMSAKDIKV